MHWNGGGVPTYRSFDSGAQEYAKEFAWLEFTEYLLCAGPMLEAGTEWGLGRGPHPKCSQWVCNEEAPRRPGVLFVFKQL